MRLRTTLAVIGLIAAMGMFSGCKSWCRSRYPCEQEHIGGGGETGEGRGPWLKAGVVRAERDNVLVGVMSSDPSDPDTQLWLLRATEYFPVEMWANGTLSLEYLDLDPMDHDALCAMFGDDLTDPGNPQPPTKWTLWSGYEQLGPCE